METYVSMAGPCEIFTAGIVLHSEDGFSDRLAGSRANDVAAENLSVGLVHT